MISWLSFEWKTQGLSTAGATVAPLVIRPAEKDEEDAVEKTISSAFTMDPSWGDISRLIVANVTANIAAKFADPAPSCIVLLHGQRIVGASLLDTAAGAPNHLLTGPCVLHEYRNRGLGSGLLLASLAFLADHKIPLARGITRAQSITARFIYPKFGGSPVPCESGPFESPGT